MSAGQHFMVLLRLCALHQGLVPFPPGCRPSQEKRALLDSVAPYSASTARTPGPSPGGAMSPYAARPLPGTGAAPSPAYRGAPSGALGMARSPLGRPLAAGNLALRGRAAKYAEVVRKMNAAGGVGGQGYSPVQEFMAACADESGGGRGWERGVCSRANVHCQPMCGANEGGCAGLRDSCLRSLPLSPYSV